MKSLLSISDFAWSNRRRPARLLFCAGLLLLCLGCTSSTGTVSGIVLFKGDRVPSGTITFFVAGQVHQTDIHEGVYQLTGLPIGTAIVTVVRLDPHMPDPYLALNETRKRMAEKKLDAKELGQSVVTDIGQLEAFAETTSLAILLRCARNQRLTLYCEIWHYNV